MYSILWLKVATFIVKQLCFSG